MLIEEITVFELRGPGREITFYRPILKTQAFAIL